MVEISRHTPSEANAEYNRPESGLSRLYETGYKTREAAPGEPKKATVEFQYEDDKAVVFIAREGETPLGSLTLVLWRDDPNQARSGRFWPRLRELRPQMVQQLETQGLHVYGTGGIVTLPEAQGKGVGMQLLQRAIQELGPGIIIGQTKTVAAVALRRKSEQQGFRTFYGRTEITPGHEQAVTQDHEAVLEAYKFARNTEFLSEGAVYRSETSMTSEVPNVEKAPPIVQIAFEPLIKAQTRIGDEQTVMSPLMSIRRDLLET